MLLPAVGLACELFTVGGELGPDSGLLPESEKRIINTPKLREGREKEEKEHVSPRCVFQTEKPEWEIKTDDDDDRAPENFARETK